MKYNLIVLDTALGGGNERVKQCALIAVADCTVEHGIGRQLMQMAIARPGYCPASHAGSRWRSCRRP